MNIYKRDATNITNIANITNITREATKINFKTPKLKNKY
jgi:hypothetical protein